jgi:hypothetical protein
MFCNVRCGMVVGGSYDERGHDGAGALVGGENEVYRFQECEGGHLCSSGCGTGVGLLVTRSTSSVRPWTIVQVLG